MAFNMRREPPGRFVRQHARRCGSHTYLARLQRRGVPSCRHNGELYLLAWKNKLVRWIMSADASGKINLHVTMNRKTRPRHIAPLYLATSNVACLLTAHDALCRQGRRTGDGRTGGHTIITSWRHFDAHGEHYLLFARLFLSNKNC